MSIVKKFQKRKEDFICKNCRKKIIGDGFTNHCPECFYSLHIDIFPGDRLESCQGLMQMVDMEIGKGGKYIIIHQCQKCQKISRDKFREKVDNFENFLKIIEKINQEK